MGGRQHTEGKGKTDYVTSSLSLWLCVRWGLWYICAKGLPVMVRRESEDCSDIMVLSVPFPSLSLTGGLQAALFPLGTA